MSVQHSSATGQFGFRWLSQIRNTKGASKERAYFNERFSNNALPSGPPKLTHAVRAQTKSLNQKRENRNWARDPNEEIKCNQAERGGEENEVLEGTREVGAGEGVDGTLGTPLAVGMHA